MLWSPNEVLAYLKDDLGLQSSGSDTEKKQNVFRKTQPFGGFSTCLSTQEDFVLVAENSEIFGPNPLFTIPCHPADCDLNSLATKILSADYQGISSKKSVSLKHAQLLMPDISTNVHAAINYFMLFDSAARGFIRPTCIAYFTSNKYKLICLAESILKALSEASTILQQSNMHHCLSDLKKIVLEIKSSPETGTESTAVTTKAITDNVIKEVQDIIDVIEEYKVDVIIDQQISTILETLKRNSVNQDVSKFLNGLHLRNIQPMQWENKNTCNSDKQMKNLYFTCGYGLVLGFYHIFLIQKHFRRNYENIYLSENLAQSSKDERLYFGACIKISDLSDTKTVAKQCLLNSITVTKVPSCKSEGYLNLVDASFEKILVNFLHWGKNDLQEVDQDSSFLQSNNFSDISTEPGSLCSSSSGYISSVSESGCSDITLKCGHIVFLENIWEIIEELQTLNSGVESSFLEIIKLFDDTRKILFSVLTRVPIVIISVPEEMLIAQNFVRAISVFIPRGKDETVFVELDRQEPLTAENLQFIAATNICLTYDRKVEDIIPHDLWGSLCILNLRDCSLTAPAYTGVLLSNIDERFRILPLDGPAFPILVGILCDIVSAVEWWLMVTSSSMDANAASTSILERSYSRLDVQILLKLSKLCKT